MEHIPRFKIDSIALLKPDTIDGAPGGVIIFNLLSAKTFWSM